MTASSAASHDRTLAGIGLMLAGIFVFALNDALGKWLVATYSVGQLLLVRSTAAAVLLIPFLWRDGGRAFRAAPRPWVELLRPGVAAFRGGGFFWAAPSP